MIKCAVLSLCGGTAPVAELADALDLGSSVPGRESSSLSRRTMGEDPWIEENQSAGFPISGVIPEMQVYS